MISPEDLAEQFILSFMCGTYAGKLHQLTQEAEIQKSNWRSICPHVSCPAEYNNKALMQTARLNTSELPHKYAH